MRRSVFGGIDEQIANDMLNNVEVIENTFSRWTNAGDVEKVVQVAIKMMETIRLLPDEWKGLIIGRLRDSEMIRNGISYAFENSAGSDRRQLELVHDVLYNG